MIKKERSIFALIHSCVVTACFVLFVLTVIFTGCTLGEVKNDGAQLASVYCATCHAFPSPDLLNRDTWQQFILPRMGQFLGIYENTHQRDTLIEKGRAKAILEAAGIYPKSAQISPKQWEAIQQFYLQKAPLQLSRDTLAVEPTDLFKIRYPELFLSPPSTTFLAMEKGQLFFSDANKQSFFQLDSNMQIQKQAKIGEGLVQVKKIDDQYWMTVMGSFSPTDAPLGFICRLTENAGKPAEFILTDLQRPVHASYGDFNRDGRMDILVCEYGKWTGALSLWLQQADGHFTRTNLLNRSGAIATEVLDINGDGWLDFIVLLGQGAESIQLFINQGTQGFQSKEIVALSPAHGSSAFSLFDYNLDGKLDILYTAGDNADYPSPPKPYQGIYIFTQQSDFTFEQNLFLPLPGAYRAVPADFDQDGDLDLAAISFFPDYHRQALGFVFFENRQNQFYPQSLPLQQTGRWMVMDSGDFDQDGDEDLVLGSLTMEVPQKADLVKRWVQNGLPFVFLENQSQTATKFFNF